MVRMQNEGEGPYSKRQKMAREGDPNTRTVQAELVKLRREVVELNNFSVQLRFGLI